jgi:phosphoglycolate phosphatase
MMGVVPNQALISFDLDGTLVDTASELAEAANAALQMHGLALHCASEITALIGGGTRQLMLSLLARSFLEDPARVRTVQPDALLSSFDTHYGRIAGSMAVPYAGCAETLELLGKAGVRLACTTNKESRHAHRVLAATGLDAYFDLVIGGDSLAVRKPHGAVLRHVMQTLGVAAGQSAHVGDSSIDVEAARNAGIRAWVVPYGYNAGQPITDAHPDRVFATLPALAAYVLADATVFAA